MKRLFNRLTACLLLCVVILFLSCKERHISSEGFNVHDYNIEMLKDEIEILRTSIKNCYLESGNRYESEYNAYQNLDSNKELIFKDSIASKLNLIDSNITHVVKKYMIERGLLESNSSFFENHIKKVNLKEVTDERNIQLAGLIKIKNAYYLLALYSCTYEQDMDSPPVFH